MPAENPGNASTLAALLNHAGACLGAGDRAAAIEALYQAVRIAPGSAPIQHDLGYLCFQAGRLTEAIAAFHASLQADPAFSRASLGLGIVLQQQGSLAEALAAYREAVRLAPQFALAHVCLGALLEHVGDRTAAVAAFRAGAGVADDRGWRRMAHARALLAEDRDLEAEPVLREILEHEPANAMAHDMLAQVLSSCGRFDDARAHFQRAIETPQLAGSYYELVRCRRMTPADSDLLTRMQAALQLPGLGTDARIRIHLALGKAGDDLGDYAAAMAHFGRADALRRNLRRFDAAAFEARIERLMAHFTAEPKRGGEPHTQERTAILVMGLPRSGTTLIEQIISNHPGAFGAGEQPFWMEKGAAWEASLLRGDDAFDVCAAGEEYLRSLRALAPSHAHIIDKMPLNVMWAGLVNKASPGAAMICCHRNALDTALSIHRTYFNPTVAFPTGGADLVVAIRAVERLRTHWRRILPPDRYMEVQYEKLVQDPRPVVQRILAFCGLDWDEACMHPERNPRIIKTPSKWQARQPIHGDAVDRQARYRPWLGELEALLR